MVLLSRLTASPRFRNAVNNASEAVHLHHAHAARRGVEPNSVQSVGLHPPRLRCARGGNRRLTLEARPACARVREPEPWMRPSPRDELRGDSARADSRKLPHSPDLLQRPALLRGGAPARVQALPSYPAEAVSWLGAGPQLERGDGEASRLCGVWGAAEWGEERAGVQFRWRSILHGQLCRRRGEGERRCFALSSRGCRDRHCVVSGRRPIGGRSFLSARGQPAGRPVDWSRRRGSASWRGARLGRTAPSRG